MAAVAAREAGASTALVAPDRHVGGMVSGGLELDGRPVTRAFSAASRDGSTRSSPSVTGVPLWSARGPEPHVARATADADARARGCRRSSRGAADGRREGRRRHRRPRVGRRDIRGARLRRRGLRRRSDGRGRALSATPSAARRATSTASRGPVGSRRCWPRPAQLPLLPSPFAGDGSCYRRSGSPSSTHAAGPPNGSARQTAACRPTGSSVCLTDLAENRLPLEAPPGYDPRRFELLRRYLEVAGD